MKRITICAMFIALSSSIFAQTYMSVWENGVKMDIQISAIDSITFGDTETSNGIGIFSVSPNDKVTFSKGNLQYHPKKNKWQFANNQYDYFGEANENISADYNGWIDLFGWGTGNNPTKSETNSSSYKTFVDWGGNQIGDDAPNTWRTLTSAEWEYLLESRPNANKLWCYGKILTGSSPYGGENGLILLPDNWVTPDSITIVSVSGYQQGFTLNQWSVLEQLGAVFLPEAGYRNNTTVYKVNREGHYWSSNKSKSYDLYAYSFCMYFCDVREMEYEENRHRGCSVRLVKDL